MIDASLKNLKKNGDCMYTVVSVVSKRARMIVEEAAQHGEELIDTAVALAVEEFLDDKIDFYLPENYKNVK